MTTDINKKLAELKNQLDEVQFQDPSDKAHIDELISEMESADNNHESLIDSIKATIEKFETDHPRATAILNDIMVTLSNMGI